jgi:hypothetical protein
LIDRLSATWLLPDEAGRLSQPQMAATNKCLAQSNKSRKGAMLQRSETAADAVYF